MIRRQRKFFLGYCLSGTVAGNQLAVPLLRPERHEPIIFALVISYEDPGWNQRRKNLPHLLRAGIGLVHHIVSCLGIFDALVKGVAACHGEVGKSIEIDHSL
jgi:hypothetical protein